MLQIPSNAALGFLPPCGLFDATLNDMFDEQELDDLGADLAVLIESPSFAKTMQTMCADKAASIPAEELPMPTSSTNEELPNGEQEQEQEQEQEEQEQNTKDETYMEDDDKYSEDETDEEWIEKKELEGRQRSVRNVGVRAAPTKRSRGDRVVRQSPKSALLSPAQRRYTSEWRKYGQKNLKGKQWKGVVRCYYKCHIPTCSAKKWVDKLSSNMEHILKIEHSGGHNHPVDDDDDSSTTCHSD